MAGGTPTPTKGTSTPTPRPGTPTPGAAKPTKRVKLPPGIMGRTPTKGEQGRGLKQLVESFIPAGAEKSWVGIPKEKQYAAARRNIMAIAAVSKSLQTKHGLTDVQAARYLVTLAKWRRKPSWAKVPAPKPESFREK